MSVADEKKYLRAVFTATRAALDPERARHLSATVQHQFIQSALYRGARSLMIYAPVGNEVSTDLIFDDALVTGRAIYFPRFDSAINSLRALRVHARSDLAPGTFGILEPRAELEAADNPDLNNLVICVPGLAFSRAGWRLGRGGGHYDRFLADVRREAISVGLAYSFQLVDRVPHEDHDRKLNFIATESALYGTGDAPLPDGKALAEEVNPGDSSVPNPGVHNWWRGLSDLGTESTAQGRR
jgi:5-formyltetrahydrofolate cyclo-ligase